MKKIHFFFGVFFLGGKQQASMPCISYNGKLHILNGISETFPFIDSSLEFPVKYEKHILKEVPPEAFLTSNFLARHFAKSFLEENEKWIEIIFEILEDNSRKFSSLFPSIMASKSIS